MGHEGKRRASKEVHVSSLKKEQDSSFRVPQETSTTFNSILAGFIPIGLLFIFRAVKQITPNVHHPLLSAKHHGEPLTHVLFSFLHAFY